MSFRNIFVVHCEENSINSAIEKIRCFLAKLNYGVIYRPENYQDELISKIKDCKEYFTITINPNVVECDELFSLEIAFYQSLFYPKKEQRIKEQEILHKQFLFMDNVIDLIFGELNVYSIEVYISDQVSNCLEDYYEVVINDRCFSKALANVYEPRKKENYIGFKATKFIII